MAPVSVAFLASALSGASFLYSLLHLPIVAYMKSMLLRSPKETTSSRNQRLTALTDHEVPCRDRPAPVWPERLVVVQRRVPDADSRVTPATTVTYYDSVANANLIQITFDEALSASSSGSLEGGGRVLWDLELGSKTSYYFYPDKRQCTVVEFPVGILRTDWLRDAEPLGEALAWDGVRRVCGWTKLDFVDYYADYETGEPTGWYFHGMKARFDVLYYAPNQTVRDTAMFEPPGYCAATGHGGLGSGERREMTQRGGESKGGFIEVDDLVGAEERDMLSLMHRIGRG